MQRVMEINPEAVRQEIQDLVQAWYGVPYEWGGNSKQGIDCSGFVRAVYKRAFGWVLPRVTEQQGRVGSRIPPNQLRAGDLVFFQPEGKYNHVGIYLQDNEFVHVSASEGVTKSSLRDRYWSQNFWMSRRLLQPSRIPDPLKEQLVAYRRGSDSSAASGRVLSHPEGAPGSPKVDTTERTGW
jgi:cell wall-associated NlpC family hydrolase